MEANGNFSAARSDTIHRALDRLRAQPQFARSPALSEMLRYIVTTSIEGRADNLKAYTIATSALGRPATFDPQSDPIVRVMATRLRRALEAHAQGPGKDDEVAIFLDPGSYAPRFDWRERPAEEPTAVSPSPPPDPVASEGSASGRALRFANWWERPALAATIGLLFLGLTLAIIAFQWTGAPRGAPAPASDFALSPRHMAVDAPAPLLEARPTLIIGALDILDPTAQAEMIGKQIRARMIGELRPFDDILDLRDDPSYVRGADSASVGRMTYLLEGSLVLGADKISITGNITHVATGLSVFSGLFDVSRPPGDDITPVADAVRRFAVKLAQPYGVISTHVWQTIADNRDEHSIYACQLRVFSYWQTYTRASFDEALDCIRKRLVTDPASAPALANLAFLYVEAIRAHYVLPDPDLATREQLLDRALKTANRAVQASPLSARTHSALAAAYMINRSFEASIASAREALSLNPNDPELKADLGAKLTQVGAYADALALLRPVIALGGAQPQWRVAFAALAGYMLDDKVELARRANDLKKEDGLLPTTIRLLDAIARKDATEIQSRARDLSALAPEGQAQVVRDIGDRIYNQDILRRIARDLASIFSN